MKKFSGFIAGFIAALIFVSIIGTTIAADKSILVSDDMKILVNGEIFEPKDVNGDAAFVFVYNGTTYAPLRALANAYGLEVGYNHEQRLATVDDPVKDGLQNVVYFTRTGSKYHYDSTCNGGTYYPTTLEAATQMGLKPCTKCVHS